MEDPRDNEQGRKRPRAKGQTVRWSRSEGEATGRPGKGQVRERPPVALTIAGSDSGGGAGIQADLKTFCAFGVYGMTVITAVTAQNTLGVQGVSVLPPSFVAAQLDSVLSDIGAEAAKTGMLATARIIAVVAEKAEEYGLGNLVVDPVMVAKSGHPLLDRDAVYALRRRLLPRARLVTPNIPEASALTGIPIRGPEDMEKAALAILSMGAASVVVKGGHLAGPTALDLLHDGRRAVLLAAPRVRTRHTHGTGCTFAAAIAAALARGLDLEPAVRLAKEYLTAAVASALPLGHGTGPTNHLVPFPSVKAVPPV